MALLIIGNGISRKLQNHEPARPTHREELRDFALDPGEIGPVVRYQHEHDLGLRDPLLDPIPPAFTRNDLFADEDIQAVGSPLEDLLDSPGGSLLRRDLVADEEEERRRMASPLP